MVGLELLAWIKVTWLKDFECTKIRQLLRHKGFALRMVGCWVAHPFSVKCVSGDEGLRKKILSKARHSSYIVHSGRPKKYKDEARSRLELSTYLSSSLLQVIFGMLSYEALYGVKCWSHLYWDSVGRRQCWGLN